MMINYTQREGTVLGLVESGMTQRKIAEMYKCTPARVRTILGHANRKKAFATRMRRIGMVVTECVEW